MMITKMMTMMITKRALMQEGEKERKIKSPLLLC
jgi:hypothetical protein